MKKIIAVLMLFAGVASASYNPIWDTASTTVSANYVSWNSIVTNGNAGVSTARIFSTFAQSGSLTGTGSEQTFSFASTTGTLVVPSSIFVSGNGGVIMIHGTATAPTLGLGTTVQFRLKDSIGDALAASAALPMAINLGARTFWLEIWVKTKTTGSSGTIVCGGHGGFDNNTVAGAAISIPTTTTTFNTGNAMTLSFTFQGSGATNQAVVTFDNVDMFRTW